MVPHVEKKLKLVFILIELSEMYLRREGLSMKENYNVLILILNILILETKSSFQQ